MPHHCDVFGAKQMAEHVVAYKYSDLVHVRHKDLASEWCCMGSCALSPSHIKCKPYMKISLGLGRESWK